MNGGTTLFCLAYFSGWVLRNTNFKFLFGNDSITINRCFQIGRKCIHAGNPHAMETTRNLISILVKLTSRMKHSQNYFKGRLLLLWVHVGWNSSTIVLNSDGIVFIDCNSNGIAMSCESFIDGIIDYFPDQVVQAFDSYIPDVHGRTLSNCF